MSSRQYNNKNKEHAHYIFVRQDLPVGILSAMITHAAGESVRDLFTKDEFVEDMRYGLPKHTAAVVLAALDEAHLERILSYLIREDIAFHAIHEEGGTYDGQLMSIGIIPCQRHLVAEKLKDFILLRELTDPLDNSEVL